MIRLIVVALLAPAVWGAEVTKVVGDQDKAVLFDDGTVMGVPLDGRIVDIGAGGTLCGLRADGSLVEWGPNKAPQTVPGISGVARIGSCGKTWVMLMRDGTVMAWGSRGRGLVGDGKHPQRYGVEGPPAPEPVRVPGVSGGRQISVLDGVALVLLSDGTVMSWGTNYFGALGREPRQELPLDAAAVIPGLTDVTQVVAGYGVSTALKVDGTVWVWGANWNAQFGNGDRTDPPGIGYGYELKPQKVPGVSNVLAIACGGNGRHTLALLNNGTVMGWGNTDWGQIGAGVAATFQERPVTVKITGVKRILAAGRNSFAVTRDGAFWAWGSGGKGEWPLSTNLKLPTRLELR